MTPDNLPDRRLIFALLLLRDFAFLRDGVANLAFLTFAFTFLGTGGTAFFFAIVSESCKRVSYAGLRERRRWQDFTEEEEDFLDFSLSTLHLGRKTISDLFSS